MNVKLTLHAVLISAPLIFAQTGGDTKVEQEIVRLEDQWYKAFLNSDAETIETALKVKTWSSSRI